MDFKDLKPRDRVFRISMDDLLRKKSFSWPESSHGIDTVTSIRMVRFLALGRGIATIESEAFGTAFMLREDGTRCDEWDIATDAGFASSPESRRVLHLILCDLIAPVAMEQGVSQEEANGLPWSWTLHTDHVGFRSTCHTRWKVQPLRNSGRDWHITKFKHKP